MHYSPRLRWLPILAALFVVCTSGLAQTQYPPRMFGDTANAPFYHGVASGDPLPSAVLLWTRVTPDSATAAPISLTWQLATDAAFNNIGATGNGTADATKDFTLTVDATGLTANTVYYYRFQEPGGAYSRTGRTKTAPTGSVDSLKMAVLSCSSIYSGFFNAYARLAERTDIDVVVHLGDYIYDFVDNDEEVRVPTPYPTGPQTVDQWRDRHEYYLLDPDLREARANHPWVVLWDNHDLRTSQPTNGAIAFLEWVPVRLMDTTQPERIYRSFQFGDLLDLHILDILLYRDVDTIAPNETSILGNIQNDWFVNSWEASTAKWNLIGSQKMAGGWYANGLPNIPQLPNDNGFFSTNSWDGYVEYRKRLFAMFDSLDRRNNVFLSGDAHISMAMDLAIDPFDSIQYDKTTGVGAVGVEFLPTSVSRGNFDEMGLDLNLVDVAVGLSKSVNPHHVYMEVVQHGYGVLNINKDSIRAEFWYSPILQEDNTETLGESLVVKDGEGHWMRKVVTSAPAPIISTAPTEFVSLIRPNPAHDWIEFDVTTNNSTGTQIKLFNLAGKNIKIADMQNSAGGNNYRIYTGNLQPALYYIQVTTAEGSMIRQFVKQ